MGQRRVGRPEDPNATGIVVDAGEGAIDLDAPLGVRINGTPLSGAYAPLGDFPRTFSTVVHGTGAGSVANRGEWVRAVGSGAITKLGIHVGVQSGNICVAVYANSGVGRDAKPAARKATSGSVACPATGYAEVALLASVAVEHGDWFFLAPDNTTATFTICSGTLTTAAANGLAWWAAASFPAPDPAPALSSGFSRTPLMVGVA